MSSPTIAIIGGGAAGFFGAITAAITNPLARVILLEKTRQVLSKVRISGGGRCNVTHSCFDPSQLILNYPRGGKELRGPFNRFQPKDTIKWFEGEGVQLKTESDGRMFPITDSSETIISCLLQKAQTLGIELRRECGVSNCHREGSKWILTLSNDTTLACDSVLVASGGNSKVSSWLEKLGHIIIPSVPSLFTFNIPDSPLNELAGISVSPVKVQIEETSLQQVGPLLITHWGFSGPAVLKLSAWGARTLHEKDYKAIVKINWLPEFSEEALKKELETYRSLYPTRFVSGDSPFPLPKKLWKALTGLAKIPSDLKWTVLTKQHLKDLIQILKANSFNIQGKSTNKDEFVTCGGVKLQEVDFKTMQSKVCPGIYFAGEILDIDGVTGGFNFQNAWTTGWIAGQSMAHQTN